MLVYTLIGIIIFLIILGFIIVRNLLIQTEQLEDRIIDARNTAVDTLNKMRELDERGVFEKDDEVGTAFTKVILLIENLERNI